MFFFNATSNNSKQPFFVLALLAVLVYATPSLANKVVDGALYKAPAPFAPMYSANAPGQPSNPFPMMLPETFSAPTFGDLDGDGDYDMLSGEEGGGILYFLNTGTATTPSFEQQTGEDNPFDGVTVLMDGKTAPGLADLNGDDLLDVLVGDQDGGFTYYENTGTANAPEFTLGSTPTGIVDIGNRSHPVFADLDGDEDVDMISGEFNGTVFYFENNGDGTFTQQTGSSNPFSSIALSGSSLAKPALGDVDADGDYDLVLGSVDGTFLYYENTGSAEAGVFEPVTGVDNPFDGFDAIDESVPAIVDLTEGNGVDLISGNTAGDYFYYINSDPLPVELTSFGALLDGENVRLSWETASETNNAGFEVQQYIAGSFQAVGWVNGAGTTVDAQSYAYTVDQVAHGSHRFRLKQVDFDGTFAYSSISEVARPLEGRYEMEAPYPNPFNPQATFNLTIANDQYVTIAVYDMQGRMVGLLHSGALSGQEAHQFTIDGSQWGSGNYLIRAVGESFNSSQLITLLK